MAKFTKLQTLNTLKKTGLVPIFYHNNAEIAKQVVKACYQGGVRIFEFTNRGDFAAEVFADLIKYASTECPDLIVGIGSVVDDATAALYIQLGANFVVSPYFHAEVAKICNRRLIPYIPGCGSLTEVGDAQESGCDICKIFPAENLGGSSFVKNILAPMPWSQLMITGGVEPEEENLKEWITAGSMCIGIGSKLFSKERIESENWSAISHICSKILEIIQKYKDKKQ